MGPRSANSASTSSMSADRSAAHASVPGRMGERRFHAHSGQSSTAMTAASCATYSV